MSPVYRSCVLMLPGVATYGELTIWFDDDGRATEMTWEYYAD